MFLSRFWSPYQNQRRADRRYALQDMTETPAAWWPTHMVRTCGTVISMVKIDMNPRTRLKCDSEPEESLVRGLGSGAKLISYMEASSSMPAHLRASARSPKEMYWVILPPRNTKPSANRPPPQFVESFLRTQAWRYTTTLSPFSKNP